MHYRSKIQHKIVVSIKNILYIIPKIGEKSNNWNTTYLTKPSFFQCFLQFQYFNACIHNFNESKKKPIHWKAQAPPKDKSFLSQTMIFMLQRANIPLKSNKKRRLSTISCILFCVLIW